MPIYEYRCSDCNNVISILIRDGKTPNIVCNNTSCGSKNLKRIMSSFSHKLAWDDGLNLPSFETLSDRDDNNPDSINQWVKGMRKDMGDNFGKELEQYGKTINKERSESL